MYVICKADCKVSKTKIKSTRPKTLLAVCSKVVDSPFLFSFAG